MNGFKIKTAAGKTIRFSYYMDVAPVTANAFEKVLPFEALFCHARISGQEFWTANAVEFDIIQENASVFAQPGEITLGTLKPGRSQAVCGSIGVYYGEGKGLDASNIFGKVFPEDFEELQRLGENIWKKGEQLLRFEPV